MLQSTWCVLAAELDLFYFLANSAWHWVSSGAASSSTLAICKNAEEFKRMHASTLERSLKGNIIMYVLQVDDNNKGNSIVSCQASLSDAEHAATITSSKAPSGRHNTDPDFHFLSVPPVLLFLAERCHTLLTLHILQHTALLAQACILL